MKKLFLLQLIIPLISFGQTHSIDSIISTKIIHESKTPVHSILLYIEDVDKNIIYSKGVGSRGQNLQKVSKNDQFRIASSTKLFVSTIILKLAEEGKLNLNDKAFHYLKNINYLDFDSFHVYNGKNYSSSITIQQLLSHRSGLADIFSDRQNTFFNYLLQNPNQQYTPKSIIELYYQFNLNKESKFIPNNGWHYSDINYVLLGLIIEQIEKVSLSKSIRNRILIPLKMEDTFLEYYEPKVQEKVQIYQYVGSTNFSKINTSFDWAGGGYISSNKDLATFIKSLFKFKLINKRSLNKMIDVQFTNNQENRYGLGIYESEYNGNIYFGHYGFYGTYIGYCPKTNHVISYSISQATPHFNVSHFIEETLKLME